MGDVINAYRSFSWRKMKGRANVGNTIINKCNWIVWNASLWIRALISLGCCEYGNEPESV